jgi:hypothetical protein
MKRKFYCEHYRYEDSGQYLASVDVYDDDLIFLYSVERIIDIIDKMSPPAMGCSSLADRYKLETFKEPTSLSGFTGQHYVDDTFGMCYTKEIEFEYIPSFPPDGSCYWLPFYNCSRFNLLP